MSVIGEFTVPYTDFALGRLLEVDPEMRVELENIVPTGDAVMPYIWVSESEATAVEEVLQEDPLVTAVTRIDEVDGDALFRVDWAPEINGLVRALIDIETVVLEAIGTGDNWSFRLRFPNHDSMSRFYSQCREDGISLSLDRVYNPTEQGIESGYGLTPRQRETLLTALEAGYFDVPRQTTLVELGERLGVSDTAVSQRLRRGLSRLLDAAFAGEAPVEAPAEG